MKENSNEILFKKFEIQSCFKKDEHSAVYLANHIFLEKKVFLKILNIDTIPDSSIIERFKREAKILAQLEHPNIIKVFDFGMFEKHFYISFEFFESKNLRQVLNSIKLSEENKKNIFLQIVKALDFAHSKNVIHRDIKPENILVNENYEVKLTDFGLAQDSLNNFVTQKYSVVGTPAYMSPEQIQGEQLTFKSDLFSLGITTAELFLGKNIFLGENTNETINNIISFNEDNYETIFQNFSDEINKVLKGLLAFNPNDRFDSCKNILKIFNVESVNSNKIEEKNRNKILLPIFIFFGIISIIFLLKFLLNNFENRNSTEIHNLKTDDFSDTNFTNQPNFKAEKVDSQKLSENEKDENLIPQNDDKIISPENLNSSENIFGELFIKCYPWAKVYLDNKFIETTPLEKNITTKSGNYLLTLVHPDYPKYSDSIKINPKKLTFIEINLDTLFGYFDCQIYPWGEIYLNGEKKGITPLEFPIKLIEGNYKLTLKNPQFSDIETIIKIVKNDTLEMKFNMKNYQ
ncbi:MAG: serine/threonine protein kinase [Ignavibacteriae bacterium]|nr:serine/threonine protein kinase [Ignavibacteriota bacterium]